MPSRLHSLLYFAVTLLLLSTLALFSLRSNSVEKTTSTGSFQGWKQYIQTAMEDGEWHKWDCDIQTIVNDYNTHLANQKGYVPLNWQWVKAILWVESGGGVPAWNSKPMQIGVANDPGLGALLHGDGGGELILPPSYQKMLTTTAAKTDPVHNIRAGVGYLLMRMARFEQQVVADANSPITPVTVKAGDNLSLLAKRYGSTVEHLQALNPGVKTLRIGQTINVQKASQQKVITNWRSISSQLIHARYNGFGDPNYARKLDYVLPLIQQGAPTKCT